VSVNGEKYSWQWVRSGDVLDIRDGTHDTPKKADQGFPLITSKNLSKGFIDFAESYFISALDHQAIKKRSGVSRGDILMPMIGTIGNPVIVDTEVEFSIKNVALFRKEASPYDERFLFHLLKSPIVVRQLDKEQRGGTQKFVSLGKLRNLDLPLPPLPEQKRIAVVLDKANGIRRKREKAIELTDSFLRSMFLEMFGDPVSNPKKWDVMKVGEVCDSIVPGRDKPKSFTGTMPWVLSDDLNHGDFTSVSKQQLGLTDAEITEVRARVIPKGSVLMTCVGRLGVVSIAGCDLVINQQLHSFQCKPKINNLFLCALLPWRKKYMEQHASATTVPYMNKTTCNSIPIIVPPVELQNQFARVASSHLTLKAKLGSSLQMAEALSASLSKNLFDGVTARVSRIAPLEEAAHAL
jgi:type I restriction enzyme S subunit